MIYKIGILKNPPSTLSNSGDNTDPLIVVTEILDDILYNDITSIKNWDDIGYKYIDDVKYVRDGICTIVDDIGWDNLTNEDKIIASKWFCVDKILRDEVLTDSDQKKYIDRIGGIQLRKKPSGFEEIYNSSKLDIDTYLNRIKFSSFIKSVEFSIVNMGSISTTSTDYVQLGDSIFNDVPIGTYFLNFNCNINGNNNTTVTTSIYINGQIVSNSINTWQSNKAPGGGGGGGNSNTNTHSYINFPVIIDTTSTISIRWKTIAGIAKAKSRTYSLIKL